MNFSTKTVIPTAPAASFVVSADEYNRLTDLVNAGEMDKKKARAMLGF